MTQDLLLKQSLYGFSFGHLQAEALQAKLQRVIFHFHECKVYLIADVLAHPTQILFYRRSILHLCYHDLRVKFALPPDL